MQNTHRSAERRRHPRVDIGAAAQILVSEGQSMGHYAVENVSAGGAFMMGSAGLQAGETVKVFLQLAAAETLELLAEVRRVEARDGERSAVALAWKAISADAEDAIHAAVLAALERQVALAG